MSEIEGSAIPIIEPDHEDKLTENKKEQLKIQPKKFLESVGWSILFVLIYTLIGFSLLTIKFGDDNMWQTKGADLFKTLLGKELNEDNVFGVNWWNKFILGEKAMDGYEDGEDNGLAGGIFSWNNFYYIYQEIKLAANNWEKTLLTLGNNITTSSSTTPSSTSSTPSTGNGVFGTHSKLSLMSGIGNMFGKLFSEYNVNVLTFLFSPIILALLLIATPLIALVMPFIIMMSHSWEKGSSALYSIALSFSTFFVSCFMAVVYTILSTKDLIVKIFFYTFGCFFNGDIKSSTFPDLKEKLKFFNSTQGLENNIHGLGNIITGIFLLLILISAYYYINVTFASGGFVIYLIWIISLNFSEQLKELGKKYSGMFSN